MALWEAINVKYVQLQSLSQLVPNIHEFEEKKIKTRERVCVSVYYTRTSSSCRFLINILVDLSTRPSRTIVVQLSLIFDSCFWRISLFCTSSFARFLPKFKCISVCIGKNRVNPLWLGKTKNSSFSFRFIRGKNSNCCGQLFFFSHFHCWIIYSIAVFAIVVSRYCCVCWRIKSCYPL